MRTLKFLLNAKPASDTIVVDVHAEVQRILTEYVLNMAVTALAHGDITPLYDQYMADPRLSEDDRDELARAFLLLQMAAVQSIETE